MVMQLEELYRQMSRSRRFELAVAGLWQAGAISGEMHLGTGEEAVAAGVVSHLGDGDGLALAHRATPPLVVRGVDLADLLREFLGHADGLCSGRGGHMHLFSRRYLTASSGIVGASLPLGAGFALAARNLRPRKVGVAFVGDGALNQGMALETLNLAPAWSLPMMIVCIDNGWAIATSSGSVTSGDLRERARAFGWRVREVDGGDVLDVYQTAGKELDRVRSGKAPAFLFAKCPRLDGHFLGDPLQRQARDPLSKEARGTLGGVVSAAAGGGSGLLQRATNVGRFLGTVSRARRIPEQGSRKDPLRRAARAVEKSGGNPAAIDAEAEREIERVVHAVLETGGPGSGGPGVGATGEPA